VQEYDLIATEYQKQQQHIQDLERTATEMQKYINQQHEQLEQQKVSLGSAAQVKRHPAGEPIIDDGDY